MRYLIAFAMAWGSFLIIPSPVKMWEEKYKRDMLAFLPTIGLIIGGLWVALQEALIYIDLPHSMSSVAMTIYILCISGLFHLDGFMDCSDAMLSRKSMEEKQRILKEPTVGAFAVIMVVILFLIIYGSFDGIEGKIESQYLVMIPVLSRYFAGSDMMLKKMISHSQYAKEPVTKKKSQNVLLGLSTLLIIFGVVALTYEPGDPLQGETAILFLMAVSAYIYGKYARKKLGGMSGDIAGFIICMTEMTGIIGLALITHYNV